MKNFEAKRHLQARLETASLVPRRAGLFCVLCLALGALGALGAFFVGEPEARADIFKYQTESGEVLVTTKPRKGMKLIERIRTKSSSSKKTTRKRRKGSAKKKGARRGVGGVLKSKSYDALILEASEAYELPFAFIKAVVRVESNFNPRAVSRVGAMGLMQLMPPTAEDLGVSDAFDPRENIFGGTKYLRMLTNRYDGDINMVLSAYNAGLGNVDKYRGIPFDSTQQYVKDVYRWYQTYQKTPSNEAKTGELER